MNLGIKAVICISFLGVLGLGLSFWATGLHTTYGQIPTTPNNQTVDERSYAQKLYESLGFVTSGLRKGYYSDDGEDALAMTLELVT